uniref:Uncharacterized protein n=1 Tax=Myotis myotis TaxID=51298 RepID=A0A7J7XHI7_MYOMY|nr:hypothetical protein mMyoMyo1_011719 [Myotis myotis]
MGRCTHSQRDHLPQVRRWSSAEGWVGDGLHHEAAPSVQSPGGSGTSLATLPLTEMVPPTTWRPFLSCTEFAWKLSLGPGILAWHGLAWPGLTMPKMAVPHLVASQSPDPVIPGPGSSCGLGDLEGESILTPPPVRACLGVKLWCPWGEPLSLVCLRVEDTLHLPGQWWLQAGGVSSVCPYARVSSPFLTAAVQSLWGGTFLPKSSDTRCSFSLLP